MVDDRNKPQLPEERQFRAVLWATCLFTLLFVYVFVMLTACKSRLSPEDITADWFAAWGQWAGGLMTGAAFLIAAYSIAVSSAHARVDREDAARVRESEDMAQARLLIIYRVETPTIPRSMVTYRLENRSGNVFFDVTVPYVDRQNDSGDGFGRTTPADADTSMQYLPEQELLTPHRTGTEHEGWFTQVIVYTADYDSVRFAVEYTDAAGRKWKQHLGGKIERMFPIEAVPVRPADRFQPPSQIRLATAAEMSDLRGGADQQDWTELNTVTSLMVSTWQPARRIGRPDISVLEGMPARIALDVAWTPAGPEPWWAIFKPKLRETHPFSQTGSQGEVKWVHIECAEDALESVIEAVDKAIEYANEQFEESIMKPLRAAQADAEAEAAASAAHRQRLEARVDQLQRPDPEHTPWGRRQFRAQHQPSRNDDIDRSLNDNNDDHDVVTETHEDEPPESDLTH
ncbi:hypothetical protein [Mycolicibacterium fortuitum]|uniref:hypothetical protein n=1 Tax=Mycolicibacterium fortuitum TaxID=1766 RepID=UPI000ADC4616|nr:hypothetical protein [Mycolicibacterium fortuitum]